MSGSVEANSGILEEMTLEEVRAFDTQVVVIAIGSTEPHGPHLPYGTDSYITGGICQAAVRQANRMSPEARVLLYPTLPLSNNVNFKAFPFAGRIAVRTLMLVLSDIIAALEEDGIRKIVLVNGHGGNSVLPGVLREHLDKRKPNEGAFVCLCDAFAMVPDAVWQKIEHSSDHAGESETSCMMHLKPELVRVDKLDDFPRFHPVNEHLKSGQVKFVRQWHDYIPTSACGETRTSSAAKGKLMVEEGAANLARFLVDLSAQPWHEHFPYPQT